MATAPAHQENIPPNVDEKHHRKDENPKKKVILDAMVKNFS